MVTVALETTQTEREVEQANPASHKATCKSIFDANFVASWSESLRQFAQRRDFVHFIVDDGDISQICFRVAGTSI